jgi:hypothetical protein
MNNCKNVYNEKTSIISIPQSSPTNKKGNIISNEYSLNQHIFDPTKSSPPNEFMLKLKFQGMQTDHPELLMKFLKKQRIN